MEGLIKHMGLGLLALALALPASAADKTKTPKAAEDERPILRLCTGAKGNVYHTAGQLLAKRLEKNVEVRVIETRGSWENLEGMDASPRRCDAIIAQDDAYALYRFEKPTSRLTIDRMITLYDEHVHMVCNAKVKASSVAELSPGKQRILVNEYGSGTFITWSLFRKLNPAYDKLTAVEAGQNESLLKVVDGTHAQCMVLVIGLGAGVMGRAHDQFGDKLKLLSIDDPKLLRKVGKEKRVVYRASTIKAATYPKMLKADVATPTVSAVFFASPEWKARYPKASERLASALIELIGELRTRTAQ